MKWFLAFFIFPLLGFSTQVSQTIYLNQGTLVFDNQPCPVYQFNFSTTFDTAEAIIKINTRDTLNLIVKNNLAEAHTIAFENYREITIAPSSEEIITLFANQKKSIAFYDIEKKFRYVGISSAIIFETPNCAAFLWNLREFDNLLNQEVLKGNNVDFSNYVPNVFTINSITHEALMSNSMAEVKGQVGDSIRIHILNSGLMIHAMHFHGYHVIIESSNKQNEMIGWEKDSFPVDPKELVTVVLIPHQPGMYPVHDHNLKAVTIGGNYPGGMIAMLKIAP